MFSFNSLHAVIRRVGGHRHMSSLPWRDADREVVQGCVEGQVWNVLDHSLVVVEKVDVQLRGGIIQEGGVAINKQNIALYLCCSWTTGVEH